MTEERELRISYDDLKYISFECSCGTEITINISKDELLQTDWQHKALKCTVCTRAFDSQLKAGLQNFATWYDRIKASGQKVFFRVRQGMVS